MSGREVRKVGTREKVPQTEFPNFKTSRRTVTQGLLNVLASLQKRYGEAFASEAGLRRMLAQDCGLMAGIDTLPQALERLEARGLLVQQWLAPGGLLPDGRECKWGTRLVVLTVRRQRLAVGARNRRDHVTGRSDPRHRVALEEARAAIAKRLAVRAPPDLSLGRAKERALAELRALEAAWARETPGDPDKPPN